MCDSEKNNPKNKSSFTNKPNVSYGNLTNNNGIVGNVGNTINNFTPLNNEEAELITFYRLLNKLKRERLLKLAKKLKNSDDSDDGSDENNLSFITKKAKNEHNGSLNFDAISKKKNVSSTKITNVEFLQLQLTFIFLKMIIERSKYDENQKKEQFDKTNKDYWLYKKALIDFSKNEKNNYELAQLREKLNSFLRDILLSNSMQWEKIDFSKSIDLLNTLLPSAFPHENEINDDVFYNQKEKDKTQTSEKDNNQFHLNDEEDEEEEL